MRRLLVSLAVALVCSLAAATAHAQGDAQTAPAFRDRGYYGDDRGYRYGPTPYRTYDPYRAPQQSQRYGGGLRVMEAWYGRRDRVCDATRALQSACQGQQTCSIKAGNELCGDPLPGVVKGLTVTYDCNGHVHQADAPEPDYIGLRCN